MDKYLTTKARPGKLALLAENAAALALAAPLFGWGFIAVFGFLQDGFIPVAHTVMVLVAIPFILLLSALLERKRARIHARAIVSALLVAENGTLPFEQLLQVTGINRLEKTINGLIAKEYIRDVKLVRDAVCLGEGTVRPAVCAYCGAVMRLNGDGTDQCPRCGATKNEK